MEYLYPNYYEKFKCIADACPKTCCAGWQIEIDENALLKYKSMNIKTVDFKEECFFQDNEKNCLNLRTDGLCQLIMDYGENILCNTCATFPRHIEEFENVREYSLSISCPEVAHMILRQTEPVTFYKSNDNVVDSEEYDVLEQTVYTYLEKLRTKFLAVAQNRKLSLRDRSGLILCITEAFQNEYDFITMENGNLDDLDIEQIINVNYSSLNLTEQNRKLIFDVMRNWEFTTPEFEEILNRTSRIVYNKDDIAKMSKYKRAMCKHLAEQGVDFTIVLEQILVYFIYAYFCGSAYDEYYFGQAQLAVATCLHIQDLALAHFIEHSSINLDDITRLTYLYARELEHSIPNILFTEEYMDEHPLV